MSAAKKGLPKMKPMLSRQAANFIKKRRIASQRTMDTNANSQQDKIDNCAKINQQELTRQVESVLLLIQTYLPNLIKRREPEEKQQIRQQQLDIDRINRAIGEVEDEINRLKQIYKRPKAPVTPASQYSQQHLQNFSLATEISRKRQHLQLHIDQHTSIKSKTREVHKQIRELLPRYTEVEQKRGMKPISYGQFRKKALAERKEKDVRMRMRSISSRSSGRSRASSVRSIISGKSQKQIEPEKRNMYQMQRRKSVALRARQSSRKKYQKQSLELSQQLTFLKDENGQLNVKIDELSKQLSQLQEGISLNQSLASNRRNSKSLYD